MQCEPREPAADSSMHEGDLGHAPADASSDGEGSESQSESTPDGGLDAAPASPADDGDAQTEEPAETSAPDGSWLPADAMDGMIAASGPPPEAGSATVAPPCACEAPEAHVYWVFPSSAQGFYNLDQPLKVRSEVASATWFEDLYFVGEASVGARIGFESQGLRPDGSIGKVAVFTMYGATDARGVDCKATAGPVPETTCRVAFEFVEDELYVWRIWRQLDDAATWWWWGAWVRTARDLDAELAIGELRGPPGRNLIQRSEIRVRHHDADRGCGAPWPSIAYFAPPQMDGTNLRAKPAEIGEDAVSGCRTAQVTPVDGGVEVRFGAP